ncbi:hypothetical protein M8494_25785 [Serratia ureilytica]
MPQPLNAPEPAPRAGRCETDPVSVGGGRRPLLRQMAALLRQGVRGGGQPLDRQIDPADGAASPGWRPGGTRWSTSPQYGRRRCSGCC